MLVKATFGFSSFLMVFLPLPCFPWSSCLVPVTAWPSHWHTGWRGSPRGAAGGVESSLPASLPPLPTVKVRAGAVISLVRAQWDVAPRGIHSCYPSVSKVAAEACHPWLLTPKSVSLLPSSSGGAGALTPWHGGTLPTGRPERYASSSFFSSSL